MYKFILNVRVEGGHMKRTDIAKPQGGGGQIPYITGVLANY